MRERRVGFTLIELLVVIVIIILVSAAVLPAVLPALAGRQVSEATRILQAALAGARDAAIRANAPRGIRLLPDMTLSPVVGLGLARPRGQQLTSSRIVPIEPAPDLTDASLRGSATFVDRINSSWASGRPPVFPVQLRPTPNVPPDTYPAPLPLATATTPFTVLIVAQAIFQDNVAVAGQKPPGVFNPPTNWFWNVRIGDKIRFNESGRYYTIVGPMTVINPEGFVNDGTPDATPSLQVFYGTPAAPAGPFNPEYLFLVNGFDDNADGFIDNGFDGVDNDLVPVPPNSVVDNIGEWTEFESWLGAQVQQDAKAQPSLKPPVVPWSIVRRPVPSPGAREVSLPAGATIDLTTWDQVSNISERSRLPVDPLSCTVDVLVNQAGQVVPTTFYSSPSSATMAQSFYHFWVADRGDVTDTGGRAAYPALPVPGDTAGTRPATAPTAPLARDRMLLTLFSRTGQMVTTTVEGTFDFGDPAAPYRNAQLGVREAK